MYIFIIYKTVPQLDSPSDLLTFATVSWTETQEDKANERHEGHPRPKGFWSVEYENEWSGNPQRLTVGMRKDGPKSVVLLAPEI